MSWIMKLALHADSVDSSIDSSMNLKHELKHLQNVDTCLYCPQTFLSLDFQCRDDISELD